MRVLVAGRNANALATAAGTFANDLTIETAATKAACFALLERAEFDLIIACETLGDGSGLEVLSHVAVNTPNTLRIFAARPSTLNLLKGELGLFGLFRTLPYPINFRKLWSALNLARTCCPETESRPQTQTPRVRHVVLESGWQADGAVRKRAAPQAQRPAEVSRGGAVAKPSRQAQARQVEPAHASTTAQRAPRAAVVAAVRTSAAVNSGAVAHAAKPAQQVQSREVARGRANPTAQRVPNAAVAAARAGAAANSSAVASGSSPSRQAQARQAAAPHTTPTPRRAAAASRRSARIPESEAFKRALAKRNAAKLDANTDISPVDVLGAVQQSREAGARGERRREPAMSNDSLAQLARLTTTHRPTYDSRGMPGGKKRAAFFVGSGVFAAATAAVLTFFMLNANNSIGRSPLPLVASIERPIPRKVFPWQQATQPPTPTAPVRSEAAAPAAADLEVEAEAESEASAVEPGHPGPPQPNPPPGPAEPPSEDSPGWVDE